MDHYIIPGNRVGSIKLGMSEHDVALACGPPDNSEAEAWGRVNWIYLGMIVLFYDSIVESVYATRTGTYQTAEGLKPGDSYSKLVQIYGPPEFCYDTFRWCVPHISGMGFDIICPANLDVAEEGILLIDGQWTACEITIPDPQSAIVDRIFIDS